MACAFLLPHCLLAISSGKDSSPNPARRLTSTRRAFTETMDQLQLQLHRQSHRFFHAPLSCDPVSITTLSRLLSSSRSTGNCIQLDKISAKRLISLGLVNADGTFKRVVESHAHASFCQTQFRNLRAASSVGKRVEAVCVCV